jgi:hypothetical protein
MKPRDIPDGPHVLEPGEYGKWAHDGNWYFCSPNGLLANLARHGIQEHEDGTISVVPSILVTGCPGPDILVEGKAPIGKLTWHGYLERGIAREC